MSSSNRRIGAVFLDVGGVFHLPLHEPIVKGFADAGIAVDVSLIDRAHFAGAAAIRRAEMVEWREDDWRDPAALAYFTGYSRELGISDGLVEVAIDILAETFRRPRLWARIIPGSVEALGRIAATGVPIGIVSNSDGTLAERLLDEKLCQVGPGPGVEVGVICDSMAVGVAKPDPKIFEIALEAVGVAPEEAIHVGDTVEADVAGALAAGVRPIHLDPHGFCPDRTHDHITALDEVPTLVEG